MHGWAHSLRSRCFWCRGLFSSCFSCLAECCNSVLLWGSRNVLWFTTLRLTLYHQEEERRTDLPVNGKPCQMFSCWVGLLCVFRMANLSYIRNFCFSHSSKDELSYCLSTFEAAVEYINLGRLQDTHTVSRHPGPQCFISAALISTDARPCRLVSVPAGFRWAQWQGVVQREDEPAVSERCHAHPLSVWGELRELNHQQASQNASANSFFTIY